jgi:tetratricopeptide (TPR) repeat protein/transglutaminase-like putative cysteine protease
MATSAAQASDLPLYQAAPSWVIPAMLPDAAKTGGDTPALVIFDTQQRIEDGRLWSYIDVASHITSPEMLAQATSLALPWAPDKGDIIVHELSIWRGSQRIDLLANGQKFTVLRREQALEQRELTGILTATLAVEGLQVGDILRLRASTTSKDAALGGRVQNVVPMIALPARVAFARARISWPTATPPRWKLEADGVKAVPIRDGQYTVLDLALPAPKPVEMPQDAPSRFRHPPMIEFATFADWADVSKTFAPLYGAEANAIAPGSPLRTEVDAIMKADATPIGRAERALELVQDKIRYLAVGMDGGNYVPQKPARTWEVRYGDCKAKTVLLLSMLRAMGIDAEPVLAAVGSGDFVTERLPSAAAFNHVFVKATIGGQTLWLDGTGAGSRLADIHDTPDVGYVLPIRADGAALLRIATHANARPVIDLIVEADETASVDLPSAFEATAIVHGRPAAMLTMAKTQLGEKEQRQAVGQFLQGFLGEGQFVDTSITSDPITGAVTLKARGATSTIWTTDDRRRKRAVDRLIDQVNFDPDRSKATWVAVPVLVNQPDGMRYRLRLRLPDGGRAFALEGEPDLKANIAGYDIVRSASLANGMFTLDERIDTVGGEIAVARIPAERDALTTAKARAPRIVASADTRRRWDINASDPPGATQLRAIEAIFAKSIADDPDEASGYTSRASLRSGVGDRRGAVADLTHAIAITPTIDLYLQRSTESHELGDMAAALKDAEAARALDPSSQQAIGQLSDLKAEGGDMPGALALLDQRIALGGSMRNAFREAKAGLLGEYGDVTAALVLFDSLIADKPGSPSLMNGRCWAKGTRMVMIDSALKDCTGAIELSTDTSGPLDSRAMVWYRLGKYEQALADLDAVLASTPNQAESHFMRGIVLAKSNRTPEAKKEFAIARRLLPSVDRRYARYGIKAD